MTDEWWNDFFSGLVVDFWRAAMTPEVTDAEATFLADRLALSPGDRVLDVPCGDGRLALALAVRGCRVTGVDISEEFLTAAATRRRPEGSTSHGTARRCATSPGGRSSRPRTARDRASVI